MLQRVLFRGFLSSSSRVPVHVTLIDQALIALKMKCREWRMPDVCAFVSRNYGAAVEVVLFNQRIIVITNHDMAHRIMLKQGTFLTQRFGLTSGMARIGMKEKGLIWNNSAQWVQNRKVFEQSVARGITLLPEAVSKYMSDSRSSSFPPCGQPLSLLAFLRDFTLTMTLQTLFGISTCPTKQWKENAIVIVGNYFKAWEFYLLTPNVELFSELDETHRLAVERMHALGREILDLSQNSSEKSFVSGLRRLYDQDTRDGETELVQNICEMLLAGTDTSSLTLFYTLCFVADHGCPQEVRPDFFYEVMRLVPVGPVIMRQATEDIVVSEGFTIFKNDGVLINVAGMNSCPFEYAQSSDFNCARFSTTQERMPLSFGKGSKSCVGSAFAMEEMTLFTERLLSQFTVLSHLPSASSALQTRWDIANTPLTDIPMCLFPKNRLVYFVGQSSTGKSTTAALFTAQFPRLCVHGEFARNIMEKQGWSRNDLMQDEVFLSLQRLIAEKHEELLSNTNHDFAIVDRSPIDTLFFCRQRFGETGGEIESNILKTCARLLERRAIVIHFPYQSALRLDDGVRLMPSADAEDLFLTCLHTVHPGFHTLQALGKEDRVKEILQVISAASVQDGIIEG